MAADGDVTASSSGVSGGGGFQPVLIRQLDGESAQATGLLGDRDDARLDGECDALACGGETEHRWRAVQHPSDAGPRIEWPLHRELVGLCEPSPDRLDHPLLDILCHEDECRCARARR